MARRILPGMLIPGLLAAAMSSAFAADPVKIRVASVSVPPSMHTLYMQVAYEEGIYRRNGLEVDDILQMNSGPLVTQASMSRFLVSFTESRTPFSLFTMNS